MVSLSCIVILVAAGVYFLAATAPTLPDGGMMGGGTQASSSWIVSAGLFSAALIIGIGLIVYFVIGKNKNTSNSNNGVGESSATKLNDRENPLSSTSKTRTEKREDTTVPAVSPRNGFQKNVGKNVELTRLESQKVPGRVATGCINLDGLLFGGIPSNFAVALTSPVCDEKNVLINSFLATGAKNAEVTFYVTVDISPAKDLVEKLPLNFYLFMCNPQADSFVKKSDNTFVFNGVENLTEISIAINHTIRSLAPSLGTRRACIEIISDALLRHGPINTRRWLTELIAALRSAGFTTLAVINPQMHPAEDFHAILGLFEGEIDISERTSPRGSERFLRIKRMSNQKYIKEEILLTGE